MNKQLSLIQERFLQTLIESKKEISEEEINERLQSLQLVLPNNSFVVASVEVVFDNNYQNKDELISTIQKYLNKIINSNAYGFAFINSYGNFWLLLEKNDSINEHLVRIKKSVERKFKLNVYIGLGRSVDTLQKLNVSAVEAQDVLQYRNSFDNDGIISIDDISHFAYRSRIGSNFSYQKVINSFIIGDLSLMEKQLNDLVEEIRYTPQVSKSSIRRVMIELTVNILNIASNMNVDVDKILNGVDPYTWIISQGHTEVITAWFMRLCQQLIDNINSQRQKNEIGVIEQVCQYIEDNLQDCSLGLMSASTRVNLTPPYLSQLFKKEKGIGINAYITNKRLEKAKDLIKSTQMKFDEIALNTGFNSASYFNQVFKKEVGIAPSNYRKSQKS